MTLLLVTIIGTGAFGQLKRYDTDFTLSKKDFVITIPIEIERGQLFLRLNIYGREYRFKLDTGASQGVIYDDVNIKGAKVLGFIKSEDATGQSQQVKTVELPSFELGELTISGFKLQQMKRNIVRHREDGIIGFALFNKGLTAKIDARKKIMIISDRKNIFKKEKGEVLKYKLKWHVPYIKVSPFDGVEDEALFDTGSPIPYALNAQQFEHLAATKPQVKQQIADTTYGSYVIGHFGSEHSHKITLLLIERLKIGNFEMREIHSSTVQGGTHIGAPLLKYGTMIIDPFRKQLVFQPYDDAKSCTVANRMADVVIVEKDGNAMIGMVMKQSKAYTDGFRQGQIIEKVDGKPISFEEFNRFFWTKNQKYEFTIRLSIGIRTTVHAYWPLYYNQMPH